MADEVNESFRALRTLLGASPAVTDIAGVGAAMRVYASDQAPQNPTYPYVLIEFDAGSDVSGMGGVRLGTFPLMLLRTINRGSVDAPTRALDAAVDAALHGTHAHPSGAYTFSVERERPYRRSYLDTANNRYAETGGYYRLHVLKQAA